jgi:tRNA-modifying protein YgfZ
MLEELRALQAEHGAVFVEGMDVPVQFQPGGVQPDGVQPDGLIAARQGVALIDRSHWGRIRVEDRDRQLFLHNQSTNNLNALRPGQGCDTVFVTSTARTLDLATAYVLESEVLLLVSPQRRSQLLTWLDRYIFFGDKVRLTDVTDSTVTFSLLGPDSHSVLEHLELGEIVGQPDGSHQLGAIAGQEVRVAVGSGLGLEGYTLWLAADGAATVWAALVAAGAVPMGDRGWEQLRIEQGRPVPDQELTEDYNPLEAGLWRAVSFNKGCYIGQETIARLDTYKGVKVQLWGIRLQSAVEPGSVVKVGEDKVGVLTSITATAEGFLGLGYIRTKAGGAGLQVEVGDSSGVVGGVVIDVPFLTREKIIP